MTDQLTVMGLDLSLTSTGCAKITGGALGGDPWVFTIRSARKGWPRLDSMVTRIGEAVKEIDPDLIMVEAPLPRAMDGAGAYYHENAGLWWSVTHRIWRTGRPMVTIPITVLKKFGTGKGNADKTGMCLAALSRFGLELGADGADALWAAAAGLQHYGLPAVKLPAEQVAALSSMAKPKKGQPARPVIDWPCTLDWDRQTPIPA